MNGGTTLAALNAGSLSFKWCITIEGYSHVLTDAPTAAAVTAYAGTDWASAIGGLTVDMTNSSEMDPWEPFKPGGTCTFSVLPDAADTFGVDTHRHNAGAETQLTATAARSDTTVNVVSTTGFASAGTAFIGSECFAYTGITATTFTGCTRGYYSPFSAGGSGAPRFAEYHRQGLDTNQVALSPVVSAQPRVWIGKWVNVAIHRYVNGVLDVAAQAQSLFAGRIIEIRDDPNTGCTQVDVQNVLDVIADTTVGRSLMTGTLDEGVWMVVGMAFAMSDTDGASGGAKTANFLTVVASGASGANRMNAGFYSPAMFTSAYNAWTAAEQAAGRLNGYYSMNCPGLCPDGANHTTINWYITTGSSGANGASFEFTMPGVVALWLGFTSTYPATTFSQGLPVAGSPLFGYVYIVQGGTCITQNLYTSPGQPLRVVILQLAVTTGLQGFAQCVDVQSGILFDQYASLPPAIQPHTSAGLSWGIFLLDNKILILGSFSMIPVVINGVSTSTLVIANITPVNPLLTGGFAVGAATGTTAVTGYDRPIGDGQGPVTIQQVMILSLPEALLIQTLFYSSGTTGYNHATYDTQAFGIGVDIPGGLLGSVFETSVANLPGCDSAMVAVISKPMKLSDLLGGDLILRRASLCWKQGNLRFTTLTTPTTLQSIAALNETTKATAVTQTDTSGARASTLETAEWQSPIVKVAYNLDITQLGSDNYQSFVTMEDGTAVDDQGGAGDPRTINARNSYLQAANTGSGVEDLLSAFLASMPLTSRPVQQITVPIDQRFFEQIDAGDIVTLTDKFARDPGTGLRGTTFRPAVVVKKTYTLGGPAAGDPTNVASQTGEVTLFFLTINRVSSFCPSAQIDDTQNAGGYASGYLSSGPSIIAYAHTNSEVSELADAANFNVNDVIDIMQIDIASGGLLWTARTISAIAGNTITFSPALSSPAWDSTKKYRIRSSHYGAAQFTQQANVYQGGASGLVESTIQDFAYGIGANPGTFTGWHTGETPELVTADASGDGIARDTGHERALTRLINGINDYKSARCSPALDMTIRENTTYSFSYQLLFMSPIFLSLEQSGNAVSRSMKIAPIFRSSTGASVSIRVSFVAAKPIDGSLNSITLAANAVSAVWTTSSTTWQTGAETIVNVQGIKPASGLMWCLIEATHNGQCRGLAECSEQYRFVRLT